MDREHISGHMPEDREMPEYCPVRNFETYLQKLHPQCNRLWQFPKDSFNISDECWFQKRPIGKGTLASFMSTLSKKTGLSHPEMFSLSISLRFLVNSSTFFITYLLPVTECIFIKLNAVFKLKTVV
jgi:hypothetical protein